MLGSNVVVNEWLTSPIRYRPDDPAAGEPLTAMCGGCHGARGVSADSATGTLLERGLIEEAGRSQFEFLEPAGPGPIQDFRDSWGQGLYGAGFSTPDLGALTKRLADRAEPVVEETPVVDPLPTE